MSPEIPQNMRSLIEAFKDISAWSKDAEELDLGIRDAALSILAGSDATEFLEAANAWGRGNPKLLAKAIKALEGTPLESGDKKDLLLSIYRKSLSPLSEEGVRGHVASFLNFEEVKNLASTSRSQQELVRKRVLTHINEQRIPLAAAIKERARLGLRESNIEELTALLEGQAAGNKALEYLDLRGIPNISQEVLERLLAICKDDAKIFMEMPVIQRVDDTGLAAILEPYRRVFEGKENAFLALDIRSSSITHVPDDGFIWNLSLDLCRNLRSLHLENAEKVTLKRCDGLENLSLPNAKELAIEGSTYLEEIALPEAKKVSVDSCRDLASLLIENAEEVVVMDCQALSSIDLPQAKNVAIVGTSLENLDLPRAEDVYIDNCQRLQRITHPEAARVDILDCPLLL